MRTTENLTLSHMYNRIEPEKTMATHIAHYCYSTVELKTRIHVHY